MSIARIALRIAAVQALKGRTVVGENVLDSEIGVFDVAADGTLRSAKQKKFIAVYTDAAKAEGDDIDLRSLKENGTTELVFEFGVSNSMLETDPETGASEILAEIPATDSAFEFVMDLAARQIGDALTDPDNAWAEIFRGLAYRFRRVERERASSAAKGVKLAGQQIRITLDLIEDPAHGSEIDPASPLGRFFAAVESLEDPVLAAQAARLQAQITGDLADWEAVQRRFGMTRDELLAVGLGPIAGDDERETPDFAAGVIDLEVHGQQEVEPE